MDSGISFDASSEAHGEGGLALVARGARVRMTWTHIYYSYLLVVDSRSCGVALLLLWSGYSIISP